MMNRLYFIFFIFSLVVFSGCEYSRPLTAIRVLKYSETDSTTNKKVKAYSYKYLSYSEFAVVGSFSKRKLYDLNGNKTREIYTKKIALKNDDKNVKNLTMIKYFNVDGKLTHIDYKTFRNKDKIKEYLEKKTIYYKNGKEIKTIDKLKKIIE